MTAGIGKKFSRNNADIVFDPKRKVQFIPTGNPVFDLVTGGGFPRGRITEVFGMEHSCKTAICLKALGNLREEDPNAVGIFMDHETSYNEPYAQKTYKLFQDGKHFQVFQPDNLEQGDEIVSMLEQLDRLDLLIFDSVDAMRPKAFIEHNLKDGDSRVGQHAKGMSLIIQKLKVLAKSKNCAIVLINQMRTNINTSKYEQNVGTGAGFNVQESYNTTGGHALRFYASLRIKMEFGGQIVDEGGQDQISGKLGERVRIGNKIKVINIKNKLATPFLKGVTNFYFPGIPGREGGFSEGQDLIDLLKGRGRITQVSSKFTYLGKAISEWVSTGMSGAASEERFRSDPALMADARTLLADLTNTDTGLAQTIDLALEGVDFTVDEVNEDAAAEELQAAGIELEEPIDNAAPLSETTL